MMGQNLFFFCSVIFLVNKNESWLCMNNHLLIIEYLKTKPKDLFKSTDVCYENNDLCALFKREIFYVLTLDNQIYCLFLK